MTPEEQNQYSSLRALLEENKLIIADTNERVKKMENYIKIGFFFRIAWILVLLVLPVIVYFLVSSFVGGTSATLDNDKESLQQTEDNLREVLDIYRGQ